jgi:hypothetical protein
MHRAHRSIWNPPCRRQRRSRTIATTERVGKHPVESGVEHGASVGLRNSSQQPPASARLGLHGPIYQWQLEAENLHNLSLAVLQRRVHEFAAPEHFQIRPNLSSIDRIETPTDPYLLRTCEQQKTRSAEHYSVSVLGMTIILGVGSLLILLDWIFIKQILWFRSFTHKRLAKQADWTSGGTLQLHRLALEARGVRDWDTRHYEAPRLVEKGKMFRGLAVENEPLFPSRPVRVDTEYRGGSGGTYSAVSNEGGVTYDSIGVEKKV